MFSLKKLTCILFLVTALSACSNEATESDLVSVDIPTPLTILVDREIVLGLNSLSLEAPWAAIKFQSINNSSQIITVIGSSFIVTDPVSGGRKVIASSSLDGGNRNYEGVIFPSLDTNCDGLVSDAEASNGLARNSPCTRITDPADNLPADVELTTTNSAAITLFDARQFYVSGMADGASGASGSDVDGSISGVYRGLTFSMQARIEGWFGSPDGPERNFFKEFFFTTVAN